jgi:CRISPR/Cas system-associated endonuclease Cas1
MVMPLYVQLWQEPLLVQPLPTLGIFHRNRYNAYCLVDDIMEPYRPFVDIIVRSIIDETSHVETLTAELKNKLLQIPTVDVLMNEEKSPLMVAMQRTAASLAKCYAGEQRKYCTQLFLSMQYNSYCHFDEGEIYLAFVLLMSRSSCVGMT